MAEAKAIYPLMGIAANVALVAAGNFMKAITLVLKVGPGCVSGLLSVSLQGALPAPVL